MQDEFDKGQQAKSPSPITVGELEPSRLQREAEQRLAFLDDAVAELEERLRSLHIARSAQISALEALRSDQPQSSRPGLGYQ